MYFLVPSELNKKLIIFSCDVEAKEHTWFKKCSRITLFMLTKCYCGFEIPSSPCTLLLLASHYANEFFVRYIETVSIKWNHNHRNVRVFIQCIPYRSIWCMGRSDSVMVSSLLANCRSAFRFPVRAEVFTAMSHYPQLKIYLYSGKTQNACWSLNCTLYV